MAAGQRADVHERGADEGGDVHGRAEGDGGSGEDSEREGCGGQAAHQQCAGACQQAALAKAKVLGNLFACVVK